MTLQQIQYLTTVAECGSIGGAAKKLFTSASTISEALRNLEEECKIQIFIRGSRGMSLTREGQNLLIDLSDIQRKLTYISDKYKNRDHVYYSLAVAAQHHILGMDSFLSFLNMHSDASYEVSYKESNTQAVLNAVEDGTSDIGIVYCTKQSSKQFKKELETRNIEYYRLLSGQLHAYVGSKHPLATKNKVKIHELIEYPQISYDRHHSSNSEFTKGELGTAARQTIVVTDRASAYSLMQSSNAFAVGTGLGTSMDKKQGIRLIPIVDGDLLDVGYILHARRPVSGTVERFISLLKEEFDCELKKRLL